MRDALRSLARNGWVIGIAAAIAIGYGVVAFLLAVVTVVIDALEGDQTDPYEFELGGVDIAYGRLVETGVTLVLVVAVAAFVLQRVDTTTASEDR